MQKRFLTQMGGDFKRVRPVRAVVAMLTTVVAAMIAGRIGTACPAEFNWSASCRRIRHSLGSSYS